MVLFGEKMAERLGDGVKTDIFWNVMDFGYAAPDLLAMVECGMLGMCYFSTSYLADRAPELEIVDLPFLFEDSAHAYGALDGALGGASHRTNRGADGLQEPGFLGQRIPPSLEQRPRRENARGLPGLRVRLQPNETHVKTFELLGAEPVPVELKEGIAMIESGEVNAQENPLSNTVTYGVTNHQRRITMSGHFYGARALLAHRESFDAWPAQVQEAARACIREAIDHQRKAAQAGEIAIRRSLEEEGVSFVDLTDEERASFKDATEPIRTEARERARGRVVRSGDEKIGKARCG